MHFSLSVSHHFISEERKWLKIESTCLFQVQFSSSVSTQNLDFIYACSEYLKSAG